MSILGRSHLSSLSEVEGPPAPHAAVPATNPKYLPRLARRRPAGRWPARTQRPRRHQNTAPQLAVSVSRPPITASHIRLARPSPCHPERSHVILSEAEGPHARPAATSSSNYHYAAMSLQSFRPAGPRWRCRWISTGKDPVWRHGQARRRAERHAVIAIPEHLC